MWESDSRSSVNLNGWCQYLDRDANLLVILLVSISGRLAPVGEESWDFHYCIPRTKITPEYTIVTVKCELKQENPYIWISSVLHLSNSVSSSDWYFRKTVIKSKVNYCTSGCISGLKTITNIESSWMISLNSPMPFLCQLQPCNIQHTVPTASDSQLVKGNAGSQDC